MAVKGKVIVITEAFGGIGRGLAIGFNRDDTGVVGFDVDKDGFQETAKTCENSKLGCWRRKFRNGYG